MIHAAATLVLLIVFIHPVLSEENLNHYEACAPFNCGNIYNIGFPFYRSGDLSSKCGLPNFGLLCNETVGASIVIENRKFEVKIVNYNDQWLQVIDTQLMMIINFSICNLPPSLDDMGNSYLQLSSWNAYLTFLKCPRNETGAWKLWDAFTSCNFFDIHYIFVHHHLPGTRSLLGTRDNYLKCSSYSRFPVSNTSIARKDDKLENIVAGGFFLQWSSLINCTRCEETGGRCGFDRTSAKIICFCKDGFQHEQCASKWSRNFFIVLEIIAVGMLLAILIAGLIWGRKCLQKIKTDMHSSVEGFLKDYKSFAPKRYSYMDIRRMTNFFQEKIGQGAAGSVFKGRLSNGDLVAVKILDKSNYCREGFINEVGTVGKVHHVNIIRFLGFCSEGSKRALIYEFMHNGSLDKFIYRKQARTQNLSWEKIFDIAMGIARGIQYLHQGCNMQILHFDIKPHNVLLDGNFIPKISDFGLAKSCSNERITITTMAARGTLGYIAPELFSRNFGSVSFKSDVYSYGMLLLEMIGGRRNADVWMDSFSQIYFPSWVYDRLSRGEELGIGEVNSGEDMLVKKMTVVGLWCIQINPVKRPSMCGVVQMLEENLENLQMPPRPFLSPHPREEANRNNGCLHSTPPSFFN